MDLINDLGSNLNVYAEFNEKKSLKKIFLSRRKFVFWAFFFRKNYLYKYINLGNQCFQMCGRIRKVKFTFKSKHELVWTFKCQSKAHHIAPRPAILVFVWPLSYGDQGNYLFYKLWFNTVKMYHFGGQVV